MAGPLQHAFHVGTTDFGLLLTASLVIAAGDVSVCLASRPTVRIRLLSWTIGGWAGAMVLAALSPSYGFLLWSRMALGAVSACAGPAIASRVGDEFRSAERGSIYSRILTGTP